MSTGLILVIALAIFLFLVFIETPVALALAASGGLGILMLRTFEQSLSVIGAAPFSAVSNYSLAIIPMYVLLGMFAVYGHLSGRLFDLARVALQRIPGALGIATVAACAGFAAVSGSSVATAASIGRISVGEMRKSGYSASLATGTVAAAGTLGILIPPSVIIVMYGILTKESIPTLLLSGVVPGILLALVFAVVVMVSVARAQRLTAAVGAVSQTPSVRSIGVPSPGSSSGRGSPEEGPSGLVQALEDLPTARPTKTSRSAAPVAREVDGVIGHSRFQLVRSVVWIALIMAAVLAGVFSGLFTVIESAAIGAAIALFMLVLENYRHGSRKIWRYIRQATLETASTASMVFIMLVGAGIFSTFLVIAGVPTDFTTWVLGADLPPLAIVAAILLVLIPLGMFLEPLSIIIIVAPLVHPVVLDLGFEGAWFGILFVIMLEIGMVTPPVGMNTFVVATATRTPVVTVFRGVMPFIGAALAVVVILLLIPELILWVPELIAPGS